MRVLEPTSRSACRSPRCRGRRGGPRAGLTPFAVVGNAGTTNTGAVDPLGELARSVRAEGLWFHVDGAYGAAAALTEQGRAALAGMERADSLVIDPHKWLFQPYEAGAVLVRGPGAARAHVRDERRVPARHVRRRGQLPRPRDPAHARHARDEAVADDPGLRRSTRSATAIAHGIALAEHAEALLRGDPGWEIVTPAQLGIVCFRRAGDDELRDVAPRRSADGYAAPSTTVLRGETVLRLCTINPRTTFEEIEADGAASTRSAKGG